MTTLEDAKGCDLCCFWLAPDGTSSHVGGSHVRVAAELGDETGGRELEKKGYLHVSGGYVSAGKDMEPTQAQLDTLFDIEQKLIKDGGQRRSEPISNFLRKQAEKVTA